MEANAALRSIVRRDSGEDYKEFLEGLAAESGIETPSREQLAQLDKKRKNKGSNDDWKHPHDPDPKITKMKDGRRGGGDDARREPWGHDDVAGNDDRSGGTRGDRRSGRRSQ